MGGGLFSLFGGQLDHIINPQDGDGSLSGEFKRVDLGDHRLQYTSSQVVAALALQQVQTAVFELQTLGISLSRHLRGGVEGAKLGDQLGGILGSVDCQSLGDNVEGLAELRNGDLLLCLEGTSELLKVDAVCNIDGASASNHLSGFEGTLGNAD